MSGDSIHREGDTWHPEVRPFGLIECVICSCSVRYVITNACIDMGTSAVEFFVISHKQAIQSFLNFNTKTKKMAIVTI